MKTKLLSTFALFYALTSFSQIKGTVTDNKQQPLPFVNIYIENTFTGTTSNEEGVYELNVTTPKSCLLYTSPSPRD